jgi:hypothetical protein
MSTTPNLYQNSGAEWVVLERPVPAGTKDKLSIDPAVAKFRLTHNCADMKCWLISIRKRPFALPTAELGADHSDLRVANGR